VLDVDAASNEIADLRQIRSTVISGPWQRDTVWPRVKCEKRQDGTAQRVEGQT
jgi:hypothetical protein